MSPLLLSVDEATAALGIGRTSLYAFIKTGALTARKCGRKTVFLHDDLERFARSLPAAHPTVTPMRGPGRALPVVRRRGRTVA